MSNDLTEALRNEAINLTPRPGFEAQLRENLTDEWNGHPITRPSSVTPSAGRPVRRRWLVGSAAAILLIVGAAAVATRSGSTLQTPASNPETPPSTDFNSTPTSLTPSEDRVADSSAWAAEGERLIAAKAGALEDAPAGYADQDLSTFAYQSKPIDLDGPGRYELVFETDELFIDESGELYGFVTNAPWDLTALYDFGEIDFDRSTGVLTVEMIVQEDQMVVPYPGITFWIY